MDTTFSIGCHMCAKKFRTLFELRDHWQRDHNYNVRLVIK